MEAAQNDAHVAKAAEVFRAVGFTLAAMQFPRPAAALEALCAFNGLKDSSKAPFAWRFHPNATLRDKWLATGRL